MSLQKRRCSKPVEETLAFTQRQSELQDREAWMDCLGPVQDHFVGGSANRAESKFRNTTMQKLRYLPLAYWPRTRSLFLRTKKLCCMCAMSFVLSAFGTQAKHASSVAWYKLCSESLEQTVRIRQTQPNTGTWRFPMVSRERIKSSQGWQGL